MGSLEIDLEKCVGCGKCASVCMKNNIKIIDKKAVEQNNGCMECSHCVSMCPKGAIELLSHKGPEADKGHINDDTLKDFLSKHKNSKWFDGRMISDEEFAYLFDAAHYTPTGDPKDCVEIIAIKGERLNAFMDMVWDIMKDKGDSVPIVREWGKWRQDHNISEPNPILWEGKQMLFIFSISPEDALISSAKMEKKGFTMGICGFYPGIIMQAAHFAPEKFAGFFPDIPALKKIRCAFVIGHARRLLEPPINPLNVLKKLFK